MPRQYFLPCLALTLPYHLHVNVVVKPTLAKLISVSDTSFCHQFTLYVDITKITDRPLHSSIQRKISVYS